MSPESPQGRRGARYGRRLADAARTRPWFLRTLSPGGPSFRQGFSRLSGSQPRAPSTNSRGLSAKSWAPSATCVALRRCYPQNSVCAIHFLLVLRQRPWRSLLSGTRSMPTPEDSGREASTCRRPCGTYTAPAGFSGSRRYSALRRHWFGAKAAKEIREP